ncbi:MAG: HD domain-containing protein [Armatimonadota bacterium]
MENAQDRLEEIIQSIDPGHGRDLLMRAANLAKRVHTGQMRADGATVFEHVVGVAENVLKAGFEEPELLAAAMLHDILEQTPLTLNDLEKTFGTRVSQLVYAVTNRPGDDARDSVARAEAHGKKAILLRVCDRLDAARRASNRPEEERETYLANIRNHHLQMARRHFPEFSAKLDYALRQAGSRPPQ